LQVFYHPAQFSGIAGSVITIGTFDGVHLGHRTIIQQLVQTARAKQAPAVLITFHPHPRSVVKADKPPIQQLTTIDEKIVLLQALGLDYLVIVPFTPEFAAQTAAAYIEHFLVANFKPQTIIIGYDHHFGNNREGNHQMLIDQQQQYGYELVEIPAQQIEAAAISSTKIREALGLAAIQQANQLLGYAYAFTGLVVEGNKLGRTIGYPTANLQIQDEEKLVPANGVYAVWATVEHSQEKINGMMNIGFRPTVNGTKKTIEVNLFNFDGDLYGKKLQVHLVAYLRGETKFDGLDALKQQLALDRSAAIKNLI
jgi:riboflavin kinase / FMN adenylyltransferase